MSLSQDRLCIGLTGGIGCGKSTVAGLFAEHGAGIVDTDTIAHRLTQTGGDAIAAIRNAFGKAYITADGALDRAKMRALIFSDSSAKKRLERLLHPLIFDQTLAQIQELQAKAYVVAVVPLLPESPVFQQLVQRILVVDCSENTQLERVTRRSGMTSAEVCSIIAQQTVRAERLSLADDVIHNDGDFDNLTEQVAMLHQRYVKNGI